MSDFKAKMHQIRFPLGLFEGPTSNGRGTGVREGNGTMQKE